MKKQTQILLIHGGMTFKSKKDYLDFLKQRPISIGQKKSWEGDYLEKELGPKFQVIRPRMPLKENAKYEEWKICFERYIPFLNDGVILMGKSLGGIFLAKYLSEKKFPKKILSTFLIGAPFDGTLSDEDLVGGFRLKANLSLIEKNSKIIHLLFSKDDDVVTVAHASKYKRKIPNADLIIFKSKGGHFNVSTLPEVIKIIKADIKK